MVLRAENLIKRYKKRTVVNNVSVQVEQGEIVGLLGPNGAGKTTTFYMIVGLIKPNEGKIFLDQEDITDLPMFQRAKLGIGYLAQEASVFRKLTVEENIMAPLEMRDMAKKDRKEKVEKLLEEFSLTHVRKNLGGGSAINEPAAISWVASVAVTGDRFWSSPLALPNPWRCANPA